MKKQGSGAPLLFHGLTHEKRQFPLAGVDFWAIPLLNPRALRFLGSNKFVQLIFERALSSSFALFEGIFSVARGDIRRGFSTGCGASARHLMRRAAG
jgi:hypothetical protein